MAREEGRKEPREEPSAGPRRALWREPLLHFLVVGAVLFGIREATRDDEPAAAPIVVDEAFVAGLERQHVQRTGRPPEDLELLIDEHVRDEVLFREALRLGLERDDPIVRRRLVQKMELLLGAASDPGEPSTEALTRFLRIHPERFAEPARVSFEQVFFASDPGAEPAADVAAALESLREGADPATLGDAFPLGRIQAPADRAQLTGRYGPAFAEAVFDLEGDEWAGPLTSRLGVHLVRVRSREPGRAPALEEVREAVARAWRREARQERLSEAIDELVDRAEVVRP